MMKILSNRFAPWEGFLNEKFGDQGSAWGGGIALKLASLKVFCNCYGHERRIQKGGGLPEGSFFTL